MNRQEIYGEYEEEVWLTVGPTEPMSLMDDRTKHIIELMVELNKRTQLELLEKIEKKHNTFKDGTWIIINKNDLSKLKEDIK